jgi:transcriptional regulator with XRE-family HTH domain
MKANKIQMIKTNDGFPRRLKCAREFRGMSQAQLALSANIPSSSISHFEAGHREPSLGSFRSLVNSLNVDPEYLLNRSDFLHISIADPLVKKLRGMMSENDYDAIKYIIDRLTNDKD